LIRESPLFKNAKILKHESNESPEQEVKSVEDSENEKRNFHCRALGLSCDRKRWPQIAFLSSSPSPWFAGLAGISIFDFSK
jgi:hypothetical protein